MDVDKLNEWLSYNSETGLFAWRKSRGRCKAGSICGFVHNGYIKIRFFGKHYFAHRLAWLMIYGQWPTEQIDHMNRVKSDNRIANLRDVTNLENTQNKLAAHRSNKNGLLGVYASGNRFRAEIISGKRRHRLGSFDTAIEASAAYLAKKREIHGGCVW